MRRSLLSRTLAGVQRRCLFFMDVPGWVGWDQRLVPIGSMGRLYTFLHEWLNFMVNVGKYTVHGSYEVYPWVSYHLYLEMTSISLGWHHPLIRSSLILTNPSRDHHANAGGLHDVTLFNHKDPIFQISSEQVLTGWAALAGNLRGRVLYNMGPYYLCGGFLSSSLKLTEPTPLQKMMAKNHSSSWGYSPNATFPQKIRPYFRILNHHHPFIAGLLFLAPFSWRGYPRFAIH